MNESEFYLNFRIFVTSERQNICLQKNRHTQEKGHFGLLFVKYMFPVASNNKASIKCLHQSLTLYRQKSFSENYSSIIHRSRIGNQWVSLFLQDEGLRSFKNVPNLLLLCRHLAFTYFEKITDGIIQKKKHKQKCVLSRVRLAGCG